MSDLFFKNFNVKIEHSLLCQLSLLYWRQAAAGLSASLAALEKYNGLLMAGGIVLAGWAGWQFGQKKKHAKRATSFCNGCSPSRPAGFRKWKTMQTDAWQFFYNAKTVATSINKSFLRQHLLTVQKK